MDINKIPYLEELQKLGLKKDEYIIWGSSPLIIRGIKEETKDLDILVKKKTWERLTGEYKPISRQVGNIKNDFIVINNIDITYRVVGIWGEFLEDLFKRADKINGYNILSLIDTIEWKRMTGRKKDLLDLEKINLYQKRIEKPD